MPPLSLLLKQCFTGGAPGSTKAQAHSRLNANAGLLGSLPGVVKALPSIGSRCPAAGAVSPDAGRPACAAPDAALPQQGTTSPARGEQQQAPSKLPTGDLSILIQSAYCSASSSPLSTPSRTSPSSQHLAQLEVCACRQCGALSFPVSHTAEVGLWLNGGAPGALSVRLDGTQCSLRAVRAASFDTKALCSLQAAQAALPASPYLSSLALVGYWGICSCSKAGAEQVATKDQDSESSDEDEGGYEQVTRKPSFAHQASILMATLGEWERPGVDIRGTVSKQSQLQKGVSGGQSLQQGQQSFSPLEDQGPAAGPGQVDSTGSGAVDVTISALFGVAELGSQEHSADLSMGASKEKQAVSEQNNPHAPGESGASAGQGQGQAKAAGRTPQSRLSKWASDANELASAAAAAAAAILATEGATQGGPASSSAAAAAAAARAEARSQQQQAKAAKRWEEGMRASEWLLVVCSSEGSPLSSLLEEKNWQSHLQAMSQAGSVPLASSVLKVALDVAHGLEALHAAGLAHGCVDPHAVMLLPPSSSSQLSPPPSPLSTPPADADADADAARASASRPGTSASSNVGSWIQGAWGPARACAKLAPRLPSQQLPSQFLTRVATLREQAVVCQPHLPAHLAPELFGGGDATAAGDTFAFGALLFSLWTGELPYQGTSATPTHVREGLRPVFSGHCPTGYSRLALLCMGPDPASRPSMAQVITELKALHAACKLWPAPACSPKASKQQACVGHGGRQGQGQGQHGGAQGQHKGGFLDSHGDQDEEDLLDMLAASQPQRRGRLTSQAGPGTSSSQHSQALYTYTGSGWSSGAHGHLDLPAAVAAQQSAAAMAAIRAAALQVCAGTGMGSGVVPGAEPATTQSQQAKQGQARQQQRQQLVLPGQGQGQRQGQKQAESAPVTADFTFRPASCSTSQELLPTANSNPFPTSGPCSASKAYPESSPCVGGPGAPVAAPAAQEQRRGAPHVPHVPAAPDDLQALPMHPPCRPQAAPPPQALRRSYEVPKRSATCHSGMLGSQSMHGLLPANSSHQGGHSNAHCHSFSNGHGLGHTHGHGHGHSGMRSPPMRNPSRLSRSSLDSNAPSVNDPNSASSLGNGSGNLYGLPGIGCGSVGGGWVGTGLTGLMGLSERSYNGGASGGGGGSWAGAFAAAGMGTGMGLSRHGSAARGRPSQEMLLHSRSMSSRTSSFKVAGPSPAELLQLQHRASGRGSYGGGGHRGRPSRSPSPTPDLMVIDLDDEERDPAPDQGADLRGSEVDRRRSGGAATAAVGPAQGPGGPQQQGGSHWPHTQPVQLYRWLGASSEPCGVAAAAGGGRGGGVGVGAKAGGGWAGGEGAGEGGPPDWTRQHGHSHLDLQRQFLIQELENGESGTNYASAGFGGGEGATQGGPAVTMAPHQSEPAVTHRVPRASMTSNKSSGSSHSTVPWAALLHGKEL